MVEVLLADSLCDFEITRVEGGHEIRIDKERWDNIGLPSVVDREVPEGVENLDVPAWISTQMMSLHECRHSLGTGPCI
jgi:hypothetical protein